MDTNVAFSHTIQCPKCGHPNRASTSNCAYCNINLAWAFTNIETNPSSTAVLTNHSKASEEKTRSAGKKYYLLILIILTVLFTLGGTSAKLTCMRNEPGGAVNCVKQSKWLRVVPLGNENIRGVLGAKVYLIDGYYFNPIYRVELLTSAGNIPLTNSFTSGYFTKNRVANKVNDFVKGGKAGTLEVTDPGSPSAVNIVALVIVAIIIGSFIFRWKLIKQEKPN